jgi:hypothetical protein
MIDPWISEHSPIDAEKLHALGTITFYWNECEIGLYILFSMLSGLDWAKAWAIGNELREVSTASALRALSNLSANDEPVKSMIRETIVLYDRNRINRNTLTHFTVGSGQGDVEFLRVRGPVWLPKPIPNDLADIRRVAENLKGLRDHFGHVANFFLSRRVTATSGDLDPAVPNVPALPDLLMPPPPQPSSSQSKPSDKK